MTRTQSIQKLIDDNGYKSYLEIGLGDIKNFKTIQCDIKVGVDPAIKNVEGVLSLTSDQFFERWMLHGENYDLIFIDGLHHSDQVERDIVNSWNCLNKGGMILIHDIKPPTFDAQVVPRKQAVWTGDVWRAWNGLKSTKLKLGYIEEPYGLGVIYKTRNKLELGFVDYDTKWKEYNEAKGWLV